MDSKIPLQFVACHIPMIHLLSDLTFFLSITRLGIFIYCRNHRSSRQGNENPRQNKMATKPPKNAKSQGQNQRTSLRYSLPTYFTQSVPLLLFRNSRAKDFQDSTPTNYISSDAECRSRVRRKSPQRIKPKTHMNIVRRKSCTYVIGFRRRFLIRVERNLMLKYYLSSLPVSFPKNSLPLRPF
jgi:hypothetical protein